MNTHGPPPGPTRPAVPLPTPAQAFAQARASQPSWALATVPERLTRLRRFRHLLATRAPAIACAVARPPEEVIPSQLIPLADAVRHLEKTAPRTLADRHSRLGPRPLWLLGVQPRIRRDPWGVILILAPSNYPIFIPGTQTVQALAAGNAVVLKPGPGGRPAALALHGLLVEAGLDPGLFQVLDETPATGAAAIAQNPDRILFTGSSNTGRRVLEAAAARLIPCTAELSGCDAMIVRADADLSRVRDAILFGLRLNGGATCIAPRRIYTDRRIAASLRSDLQKALEDAPSIPLPDSQRELAADLVSDALAKGAAMLWPAHWTGPDSPGPWVLDSVPKDAELLDADLFAPVLSLVPVEDDIEAIAAVTNSRYALGASVFSRDLNAAERIARQLPVGVVTINDLIAPTADPRIPFGGRAASGYGVTRGTEGLLELTRTKVISIRRGSWLPHLRPSAPGDADILTFVMRLAHGGGPLARLRSLLRLIGLTLHRPTPAPHPTALPAKPDWSVHHP